MSLEEESATVSPGLGLSYLVFLLSCSLYSLDFNPKDRYVLSFLPSQRWPFRSVDCGLCAWKFEAWRQAADVPVSCVACAFGATSEEPPPAVPALTAVCGRVDIP